MPSIYRGVEGVNRKIISQYRGVEGVNRRIVEQWRGVEGVNRKVFAERQISFTPYTLNLDKLVGSYELQDYGTYLFIRINGEHIDGYTREVPDRVICGWEISGLQIEDTIEFLYEFTTDSKDNAYADLRYYDGEQYSSYAVANYYDVTSNEWIICSGNLVRVFQTCGSGITCDKSTKITNILLNDNQIYPII